MDSQATLTSALLGFLLLVGAGTALAQSPGRAELTLVLTPCPEAQYDPLELASLVRVDLSGLGVATVHVQEPANIELPPGQLALIQLRCGPSVDTLTIEIADLVGGTRVQRDVLVSDLEASARGRALSLAITTLLESSWALPAARGPAPESPVQLPATVRAALIQRLQRSVLPPLAADTSQQSEAPPVPDASETPGASTFAFLLAMREFPSRATALLGVELAYLPRLAPGLALGFDLEGMYGRQSARDLVGPLADIDLFWLSAGAALYLASSTEPELLLGPFVRAGYTRASTSSERAGYTPIARDRWIFAAGASALLRVRVGDDWHAMVGIDLGYIPAGVVFVADATRAAGMSDLSLAVRMGVALTL